METVGHTREWRGKLLGWRNKPAPTGLDLRAGGLDRKPYTPGLCTCDTKNPDPVWHRSNCPVSTQRYHYPFDEPLDNSSTTARTIPKPPNWPFDISYDFAEWMADHTVVKLSKHVDDQTGVISTIFHDRAGGFYAYDAFETRWHGADVMFDTMSSAEAILCLHKEVLAWVTGHRDYLKVKARELKDSITL